MHQLTMIALAFGAYYLGIVIRYYTIPGKDALPIKKQLLLGIPASLAVVSLLISVLAAAVAESVSNLSSVLATVGIIIEHGMLMNETMTKWLSDKIRERQTSAAAAPGD